jgi:hypothetical protein
LGNQLKKFKKEKGTEICGVTGKTQSAAISEQIQKITKEISKFIQKTKAEIGQAFNKYLKSLSRFSNKTKQRMEKVLKKTNDSFNQCSPVLERRYDVLVSLNNLELNDDRETEDVNAGSYTLGHEKISPIKMMSRRSSGISPIVHEIPSIKSFPKKMTQPIYEIPSLEVNSETYIRGPNFNKFFQSYMMGQAKDLTQGVRNKQEKQEEGQKQQSSSKKTKPYLNNPQPNLNNSITHSIKDKKKSLKCTLYQNPPDQMNSSKNKFVDQGYCVKGSNKGLIEAVGDGEPEQNRNFFTQNPEGVSTQRGQQSGKKALAAQNDIEEEEKAIEILDGNDIDEEPEDQ